MELEQPQQQLPRCENHNHQHIWAAFPHRNQLRETPLQKTPPPYTGDVLPGGVKRNSGLQEAGDSGAHPCDAMDAV